VRQHGQLPSSAPPSCPSPLYALLAPHFSSHLTITVLKWPELPPKRIQAPTALHAMVNIISPEQILSSVYVDFRSNIVSLRCLRQKVNRWKTRSFAYIAIFSYAIRHIFAANFRIHHHPEIHPKAHRTITHLDLEDALKVDFRALPLGFL
jgi:hypothetical protein